MVNSIQPDYLNTPSSPSRPNYPYAPFCDDRDAIPAVSIITAALVQSSFPSETAASILKQSLQSWEWIIAGPSGEIQDHMFEIPQHLREDPRVRVLAIPDRTEDESYLEAAQNARAAKLLVLRGGDLLEPTALEKLWWFLESHPQCAFARSYSVGFGKSNRLLREQFTPPGPTMFRTAAYRDVNKGGESRLQRAACGYPGNTIPEFLSWSYLAENQTHEPANDQHNRYQAARIGGNATRGSAGRAGTPRHLPATLNQVPKPKGRRRLVILAPHFEIGGADRFNLDLISCLQEDHGYDISVVTTLSSPHRWREQFEKLTPDVFTLHTFLPVEDYPRFLLNFIKSRTPDTVLITNCRLAYELLPLFRSATHGISFVDYLHMEDWSSDSYPRLSTRNARFLDRTVVSSQHLKSSLIQEGGDASRIDVCTINVDPEIWDRSHYTLSDIREKYGIPEGMPVVAFVARLCRQKRPDVMAKVLRVIRDRGLPFICLVAGDGEYRNWLENFVKKHDLQQLRLLGAVDHDQVREILAISAVCFMPSENEGIALTLYEAMSMEVPPVSADVGGQAELVSPACGVLIKPGSSEIDDYADALQRLLTDAPLRESMGAEARALVCERFTRKAMGAKMAVLLGEAPASPARVFQGRPSESTSVGAVEREWEAFDSRQQTSRSGLGFVTTALLLLSPQQVRVKMKNLRLLGKVLLNREKRRRLSSSFDARYYLSHHSDLRATGVAPLLHYSLQGYREDRLPSPHFDPAAVANRYPGLLVNPMLWDIVAGDNRNGRGSS
jgi:glycosyltransferase involved in cell wall biosynthesis